MSLGFRRIIRTTLILCLLGLILGCHHRQDEGTASPEAVVGFERIAVVPFEQIAAEDQQGGAVRCPLCGAIFSGATVAGRPETMLEARFLQQMQKERPKVGIISGEHVAGVFRRVSTASLKTPIRQILRDVGSELGAEGVVTGYLYRFRERKGESFAALQPASVAFDIHLHRVKDGALVWRGSFDRTQTALMEDLFQISSFYREKVSWVTAEELAALGMEQVLKNFPGKP